jgi:hypothetical protein
MCPLLSFAMLFFSVFEILPAAPLVPAVPTRTARDVTSIVWGFKDE